MHGSDDIWIFAYGSLMWHPGFDYEEMQPALLRGYHRGLCLLSVRYRGTEECPGLVCGLDRGGSCRGRAIRVAARNAAATLAYLDEREMINNAYIIKWLPVETPVGRRTAYCLIVDRSHRQYAGKLPPETVAEMVHNGCGMHGHGYDYVKNTVDHLDQLGIPDAPLRHVLDLIEAKRGQASPSRS